MRSRSSKIIVDADACPVKDEIVQIGTSFGVKVIMVASFARRLEPRNGVEMVQVDSVDQAADLHIANRLQAGDVLVTQDFGLAAIGLAKQAAVLSFRGQLYSDQTIDFLLERRHTDAKVRRGGKRTKGPRAFTDQDRQHFAQSLSKVLRKMKENY